MKRAITIFLAVSILLFAVSTASATETITFDEYPLGTLISNQYADRGVLFLPGDLTGRLPQISMNGAMPNQPVLRPTGEPDYYVFQGDFWIQFDPPVLEVQFESGYWDSAGNGTINVYDPAGGLLANLTNPGTGVGVISISGMGPVGKIYFNSIGDGGGADIDTLIYEPVVPAVIPTTTEWGMMIFVLLIGLMSFYFIRRQKIG